MLVVTLAGIVIDRRAGVAPEIREEERAYDGRRPPTGSSDKLCVKRVIGIRQSHEAKADIGVGVNI